MKKYVKLFMFFIVMAICFSTNINAVTNFPKTISTNTVKASNGTYTVLNSANTSYGKVTGTNLFAKSYTGTVDGNSSSGKAFCTTFFDVAPGWYPSFTPSNCKLISKWSNATAAGIGAIINFVRDSKGSMTWDDYYLAELAINRLLQDKGVFTKNSNGSSKNDVNISTSVRNNSRYKSIYNAGLTSYNNYTAKNYGTNVSLSNSNLNILDTSTVVNNEDGTTTANINATVSVTATCTNTSGSKVSCNLGTKKVTINGKAYNLTSSISNKVVTLTANIENLTYNYKTPEDGSKNIPTLEAKFSVTNKVPFQYAAQYDCGKNSAGQTVQLMTPNLLKFETKNVSFESVGKDELPKVPTTSLTINKVDDKGIGVAGATIQIYSSSCDIDLSSDGEDSDSDDNKLKTNTTCETNYLTFPSTGTDSIVTTGEPIVVDGLVVGQTYVVVETSIPEEYVVDGGATLITISEDSSKNVVTLKNYKSSFYISKQDITTKKELPGAQLEILNSNHTSTNFKWTSTDAPQLIEDLPDGDYILVETTAPKGYTVSESISFTIENGKLKDDKDNTLVMYDSFVADVPDTFSTKNIITMIIGLLMVSIGSYILVYEFKKNKAA